MSKALAWTRGEIVFDNTPLSVAIAEMNRYSKRRLTIQTRSLEDVAVNGVFRSGDVDQFAAALQAYGIAKITRRDDGVILLFDAG
jgi:transmembrane sensor